MELAAPLIMHNKLAWRTDNDSTQFAQMARIRDI